MINKTEISKDQVKLMHDMFVEFGMDKVHEVFNIGISTARKLFIDNNLSTRRRIAISYRDACEIRIKYRDGYTNKDISDLYSISLAYVSRILNNKVHYDPSYTPLDRSDISKIKKINQIKNRSNGNKITIEEANDIRSALASGSSLEELAKLFGVSRQTISNIYNNKSHYDKNYIKPKNRVRSGTTPLSVDSVDDIRTSISNGSKYEEMAEKYGISYAVVIKIYNNEIYVDNNYNPIPYKSIEKISEVYIISKRNDAIIYLYDSSSYTISDLAKIFRISETTINRVIHSQDE